MLVILTVAFGALITSHSPALSVVELLVKLSVVTVAGGLIFLPFISVERFQLEPDCSTALLYENALDGSGSVVFAEL